MLVRELAILILTVIDWCLISDVRALVHGVETCCMAITWLLHVTFCHAILLLGWLYVIGWNLLLVAVFVHWTCVGSYSTSWILSNYHIRSGISFGRWVFRLFTIILIGISWMLEFLLLFGVLQSVPGVEICRMIDRWSCCSSSDKLIPAGESDCCWTIWALLQCQSLL